MKIKKINIVLYSSPLLATLIFLFYPENNHIWVFNLIICIFLIIKHKGSVPIVIFLLFNLTFVLENFYFFWQDIKISFWFEFQSKYYLNFINVLYTLFLFGFSITLKRKSSLCFPNREYWKRTNNLGFYVMFLLGLISIVFGLSGQTILESQYGHQIREKSTLFEYFIIFYALMTVFCNYKSKFQVILYHLILIFFIFKSLLFGGRIEVLQIVLLYTFIRFSFFKYTPKYKLIISVLSGFILFTGLGLLRFMLVDGFSFELLLSILEKSSEIEIRSTNGGDVLQSSTRLIGLVQNGIISFENRIISFLGFIFNLFAPSSFWPSVVNLPSFYKDKIGSGGGGLIFAHFYVYFSMFGPLISGMFIGTVFSLIQDNNKIFALRFYSLLVFISFPRWFAYNPVILVKFCIIGVILYVFFSFTKRIKSRGFKDLNKTAVEL